METIPFCFVDSNYSKEEKDILLPKRHSEFASGFDLVSATKEDVIIEPNKRALIGTGVSIALWPGVEAQVRSRSGLSLKHGLIVLNSPGTIDADYRGEIKVILANMGDEPVRISFGMRIAQLVISPVLLLELSETFELKNSCRGENGFGSTGLRA